MRPLLKIRNILFSALLPYSIHALKCIYTVIDINHKLLTIFQRVYKYYNKPNKGEELIKLSN